MEQPTSFLILGPVAIAALIAALVAMVKRRDKSKAHLHQCPKCNNQFYG